MNGAVGRSPIQVRSMARTVPVCGHSAVVRVVRPTPGRGTVRQAGAGVGQWAAVVSSRRAVANASSVGHDSAAMLGVEDHRVARTRQVAALRLVLGGAQPGGAVGGEQGVAATWAGLGRVR